jgi:outer membrane assembly lipoprotein YfiO
MRRLRCVAFALVLLLATACGKSKPSTSSIPQTAKVSLSPAGLDSAWTEAMKLYSKKNWVKAGTAFERLQLELPNGDGRVVLSRYYLAETRVGEKSNLQAVREFRRVSDEFPADTMAPIALLRAGQSYGSLWRRAELDGTYGQSAIATYQELVARYPASASAKRAQEEILLLEDRFALKQYQAAVFYFKFKAYDSAILYLKDLLATYPRSEIAPEALTKLILTYNLLGFSEDVREYCVILRQRFPTAKDIDLTCPVPVAPATPTAPVAPVVKPAGM